MEDQDTHTIHDWEVEDFLHRCISIDEAQLDEEFRTFAGYYAYWTNQYSQAIEAALMAKRDLERTEAKIGLETRETRRLEKAKAPTVDEVKSIVLNDPQVRLAHMDFVTAEAEKIRIRGIVDAVSAKKDMLQSLGAKRRLEMQHEPRIIDTPNR